MVLLISNEENKKMHCINILGYRIEMFISIFPTYALSIYRNGICYDASKKNIFLKKKCRFSFIFKRILHVNNIMKVKSVIVKDSDNINN